MKNSRREFFKLSGLAGVGFLGTGVIPSVASTTPDGDKGKSKLDHIRVELTLAGALTEEQRARLLDIANRCPVHRTLTSEIRIISRLV